ncbi:MAG: TFIIB-type zinc ribbon-containing protein, partial [Candidatus Hodarchaeota archaeon]
MANPAQTSTHSRSQRIRDAIETVVGCSDCGTKDVIRDPVRGEVICTNCGLVLDSHMVDQGPEWRAFTSEERDSRARTGGPIDFTRHDKGLSTTIDWRDRDASGRKLAPG